MTSPEFPVAVIGLGYVGLPLAVAFGALGPTFGLDHAEARIQSLRAGRDPSGEVSPEALAAAIDGAATLAEV